MTRDEQKEALIRYLMSCISREDWHGASDACNDIRELEAEMKSCACKKPDCDGSGAV